MNDIEAYQGIGDNPLLINKRKGKLLTRLPSGQIFETAVTTKDLFDIYNMGSALIGVVYGDFSPDNYDRLVDQLRRIQGTTNQPLSDRKNESGNAQA